LAIKKHQQFLCALSMIPKERVSWCIIRCLLRWGFYKCVWRFCGVFFSLFIYIYLFIYLFYKCNLKVEQVNSMPHNSSAIKQFIFFKKKKKKSHKASAWIAQASKVLHTYMQTHPNHKRQKTIASFLKKMGEKNVIESSILWPKITP
jgi:hypothetical protein